jgi:hypothetical protein
MLEMQPPDSWSTMSAEVAGEAILRLSAKYRDRIGTDDHPAIRYCSFLWALVESGSITPIKAGLGLGLFLPALAVITDNNPDSPEELVTEAKELMTACCREFGVSPTWLIRGDGFEMLHYKEHQPDYFPEDP